ncbi:DUF2207 domain-containing protein [soil metagenome]
MTRQFVGAALAVAAMTVLAAAAAAAQDTGWVIEQFDVAVAVADDGELTVTEDITVDFGGLERRGIFRTFPVRYEVSGYERQFSMPDGLEPSQVHRVLEIDDLEVSSTAPDDVDVTRPGLTGTTLTVRIGDEDTFVTGRQTYRISYVVRGAVNRLEDVDELQWNITGDEWSVPILRASATVEGPQIVRAACARGGFGASNPCSGQEPSAGAVTFTTEVLRPGEGMTVAVGFQRDAIDVPPPDLRPRWELGRAMSGHPLTLPLAALTTLLGLGGVGVLLFRQGRDRVAQGGQTVDGRVDGQARRPLLSRRQTPVEYRPVDDLRPAQMGVLIDEKVDPVDISATLVDLAVRGHLQIAETLQRRFLSTSTDWTFTQTEAGSAPLLAYERKLLDGLFRSGPQVAVSELKGSFATTYSTVQQELYADAVRNGLFGDRPNQVRSRWLGIGVVALLLTVVLFVLAVRSTTFAAATLPLVVAAVALTAGHRWMPHRTPKGSRLLRRTLGFREFIRTAETGRMEFAEQENLFVSYLPYAVVFGAVDKWARAFGSVGAGPAAAGVAGGYWYVSSTGRPPALGNLTDGLAAFSNSVGGSLAATPSSSGSGGGASSGGGFGGGGGGSW